LLTGSFGDRASSVRIDVLAAPDANNAVVNSDGQHVVSTTLIATESPVNLHNPFGPSTGTVRTLLEVARSQGLRAAVEAADPSAAFSVASDLGVAPIVSVTASAESPALAVEVFDVVSTGLTDSLTALQEQADVAESARTTLRVLVPASEPTVVTSSKLRPLAGVVLLGGSLAVGAALVVDSLVSRRRAALHV
jgi:hypothetical protein